MNPYFELAEPQIIADVERLLSLNVEKTCYRPGDEAQVSDVLSIHSLRRTTAGIFRGQLRDWPVIPKTFRGIKDQEAEITEVTALRDVVVAQRR